MAIHVDKSSSSSLQAPSRVNTNSRNSEITNSMRRSFSENPFTKPSINTKPRSFIPKPPANSPSDPPPRSSVSSRENVMPLREYEDKENGKERILKQYNVPSPAALKGTKKFMSPTISAASKVTVSPIKKVLVERNECARTSVSISDGKNPMRKVTFSETTEEIDVEPCNAFVENNLETSYDLLSKEEILKSEEVCYSELPLKKETGPEFMSAEDPDSVNLDPSFKLSPSPPPISTLLSPSTLLAPLDADPLMPPYDPKTNYLSPRPQFLRYRPNPRVELYREKDGIHLEEYFSSGSSSDIEDNHSEISQKESEHVSSEETLAEEGSFECRTSPPMSKGKAKGSFFVREKFFVLLLVLPIAVLSISVRNFGISEQAAFKDLRFLYKTYDLSDVSRFTKAKLYGLAGDVPVFYANSLSLLSEVVSKYRGVHRWDRFSCRNLTVLLDNVLADGHLIFDHRGGRKGMLDRPQVSSPEMNILEDAAAPEIDMIQENSGDDSLAYNQEFGNVMLNETPEADDEELRDQEIVVDDEIEGALRIHYDTIHEESLLHDENVALEFETENFAIAFETAEYGDIWRGHSGQANEEQSLQDYIASENGTMELCTENVDALPREEEIESSLINAVELMSEEYVVEQSSLNYKELELSQENAVDANDENGFITAGGVELEEEPREVTNVSSAGEDQDAEAEVALLHLATVFMLPLGAAFVYFRMRKQRNLTAADALPAEQPVMTENLNVHKMSMTSDQQKWTDQQKTYSREWTTEVDMVGEPYPSEVSSYERSTSYYFPEKSSNELQNIVKKTKKHYSKEALASSEYSTESSYGSFTTYKKTEIKTGFGDLTLTPVRRSSRLRNRSASPL